VGGGSAGATKRVLCDVHTLGNRTCRSVPIGGARARSIRCETCRPRRGGDHRRAVRIFGNVTPRGERRISLRWAKAEKDSE